MQSTPEAMKSRLGFLDFSHHATKENENNNDNICNVDVIIQELLAFASDKPKKLHDNALQKDSNKNITTDSDKSKSLDNLASGVQFDKKAGSTSKTNTRPMVSYFIVLYYISNRVFYPKTHYLF